MTGQKLRRTYLGSCSGGVLQLGDIPRSSGIDLFFRRLMGNPTKPQPSEIDSDLRRFIAKCWAEHLRREGKPKVVKYGRLVWLASMPLGRYHVESEIGGGSTLYRFMPLVQRPRGAARQSPEHRTICTTA